MEKNIFMTEEELEQIAQKNTKGIPCIIKNEKRTINNNYNTLVIGEDIKQKKEKIIIPMVENISTTKETIIITDTNKTIYEKTKEKLKKQGYEIILLDLENFQEGYNPLELPQNLYKEGKTDDSIEQLNNIGYSIFFENTTSDPFWQNMAISLFTGIIIYLIEKNKKITFETIFNTSTNIKKEDLDKNSKSYVFLSSILNSPVDTKESIIAVFKQKINQYIINESRNKIFEKTTFDITNLKNKAIFIISGMAEISNDIIPIIITQIFNISRNIEEKINIILDEIDSIKPIRNFNKMINISKNINYTIITKNYTTLKNTYEKNFEELKVNFKNTLYLYSEDFETLKEISKMCENIELEFLKRMEEENGILITIRKKPILINI